MTVNKRVPPRSDIPEKYTWNAPSLFPSFAAWEEEVTALAQDIARVASFQGHLADGPQVLADAIDVMEALALRLGKVLTYAMLSQAVDTGDQEATLASGKARGLFARFMAAQAYLDPELLAVGEETLQRWLAQEPRLEKLEHYVHDLFRKQAHVRSAEVEELLGMVADPFSGTSATASALTNTDFQFEPATAADGGTLDVTQGSLLKILSGSDRQARRTAWEHYTDEYLAHENTLASNLGTSLKQNVFRMRARRHDSTLEMALFENNVPTEVFHNLIATFQKHLPTWHRYWALRRRALGVEELHPYDIWAPLTTAEFEVPYEQAVAWIAEGLAPMGEEYVAVLRQGALEDRWVDVFPNLGKRAGAFSAGWQGTHPFIVLSYNENLFSMSTLAHELGHSMHSYLTWKHQPFLYSHYSLFVAEVASNFHQAMVRAYLLKQHDDPQFQIKLLEEAMYNFHRYFFIMPTLARFELEAHRRVEAGQGVSAAQLNALMADLFEEGYGGEMVVDRDRVGITWATFGHMYIDYYVYQYATGLSGAHALAKRIQDGDEQAVAAYLEFLKAGGSRYPLDALKLAGVDLTTPAAVEVTFEVLAEMVDRLEELLF